MKYNKTRRTRLYDTWLLLWHAAAEMAAENGDRVPHSKAVNAFARAMDSLLTERKVLGTATGESPCWYPIAFVRRNLYGTQVVHITLGAIETKNVVEVAVRVVGGLMVGISIMKQKGLCVETLTRHDLVHAHSPRHDESFALLSAQPTSFENKKLVARRRLAEKALAELAPAEKAAPRNRPVSAMKLAGRLVEAEAAELG